MTPWVHTVAMSKSIRLLPGENIEGKYRPHVLSFGGRFGLALWPAILGGILAGLLRTSWWASAENGSWYQFWTFLYGNTASAFVLMFIGLLLVGVIAAVVAIKWRIPILYAVAGLATMGLTLWLDMDAANGIPLFLGAASLPAVIWVEADRRSHRYILTNMRILFQGGTIVRHERQIRYESITDIDGSQGMFGRVFRFGTIIPVTQSGFGLGADTSHAAIGVGGGASKAGVAGGVGVMAGGGKEVQVGRARSFHQLTGVFPYYDVKHLLESLVQAATATPYLREQVELQKQMVDALNRINPAPGAGSPPMGASRPAPQPGRGQPQRGQRRPGT